MPSTRGVRAPRPQWLALPLLLALVLSLFAAPAFAQRTTLADVLKAAVLRADEARVDAMLAADTDALADLLTADCLYVHSNGHTQTKVEFLEALKSGAMKYNLIRYVEPPRVRLFNGETAVITGTTAIEVALSDGRTVKPTLLITAIYVRSEERWRLASYQSTNAPAAP